MDKARYGDALVIRSGVEHGHSGGPVLDREGMLVAVVTNYVSKDTALARFVDLIPPAMTASAMLGPPQRCRVATVQFVAALSSIPHERSMCRDVTLPRSIERQGPLDSVANASAKWDWDVLDPRSRTPVVQCKCYE